MVLPDPDGSVHGDLAAERVRALCDRRAGLGGDGVLRAVRRDGGWFMDYRNSDGSVSEMCGNGIRVFARYLHEREGEPFPMEIPTRDGVKTLDRAGDEFTADMGTPEVLGETTVMVEGKNLAAPGTSRWATRTRSSSSTTWPRPAPCSTSRRARRRASIPEGVNVEFVVRRGEHHVAMRVHERGLGRDALLRHRRLRGGGGGRAGRRRPPRYAVPGRRPRRHAQHHVDRGRPDADDRAGGAGRGGDDRPLTADRGS